MKNAPKGKNKPFIGMTFKCCNVYSRIYLNSKATSFTGFCPKCRAMTEIKVSPMGSNTKFFTAG